MTISIDPSAVRNASVGDVLGNDPTMNQLQTEDFFKLLISELTQQDPFEPVKNQDLLNQISAIRNMEMNLTLNGTLEALASQGKDTAAANFMLTQTLATLALQSNMATGASLIGKKITAKVLPDDVSVNDPDAASQMTDVTGIVVGVKMIDGDVKLELDSGDEVFLMDVSEVTMPSGPAADPDPDPDPEDA